MVTLFISGSAQCITSFPYFLHSKWFELQSLRNLTTVQSSQSETVSKLNPIKPQQ